jgi:hypothetical protein
MKCSFCGEEAAFGFEGFMICAACASVADLRLSSCGGGNEIQICAVIVLPDGVENYLYTASTADEDPRRREPRLRAYRRTLKLIAQSGR